MKNNIMNFTEACEASRIARGWSFRICEAPIQRIDARAVHMAGTLDYLIRAAIYAQMLLDRRHAVN